jgi:endoglucanase
MKRRHALSLLTGAVSGAASLGHANGTLQAHLRVPSGDWSFSDSGFVIGRTSSTNASGTPRSRDTEYFDALLSSSARLCRIFVTFGVAGGSAGFSISRGTLRELSSVISLCEARGIRIVLAFEVNGAHTSRFWSDGLFRESYIRCIVEIADYIAASQSVAGLDLLNEPNPPHDSRGVAGAAEACNGFMESAVRALRKSGWQKAILVQPVAGGAASAMRHQKPLDDKNIVYSFHFYVPHDITHQFVGTNWSRAIPYPADISWGLGAWDPGLGVTRIDLERLVRELAPVVEFQRVNGARIYVGEFSCVRWAPADSSLRYVLDCLKLFRSYDWAWAYHEFRGWHGWDAELPLTHSTDARRSRSAPTMRALRSALQ